MINENLGIFLREFGVPCSCNQASFVGVLDTPTEVLNMGSVNVLSTMYSLLVQSSDVAAASIKSGAAVTVNGQAYVARDVLLQDDGAFSVVTLSK